MTATDKALLVKQLARACGFDLVGVAPAKPLARAGYYRDWVAAGYAGSMSYLGRNVQLRENPAELLPGARSVICVAVRYGRADAYIRPSLIADDAARAGVAAGSSASNDAGRPRGLVAQYARGRDYHVVLRGMLDELLEVLRLRLSAPFAARTFVDTGPLLERELAASAGLGWIGKNTCLLNATLGSYLFLAEVVTDLELGFDTPLTDGCARCRRCLDACPTGALIAPRVMDARRCISYLTIEHRADVPQELRKQIGVRVYGCDVCQQVCPYNANAPRVGHSELAAEGFPEQPDLQTLLEMTSGSYRNLVRDSAVRRASRAMLRRNAQIAMSNVTY